MFFSSNKVNRQFFSLNSMNDDKITLLSESSASSLRVNQINNQSFFAFDIFYANKQQHLQKTVDIVARNFSTLFIKQLTYIR